MTWTLTHDTGTVLAAAGASLAARPVEHTVALTVTEREERLYRRIGYEPVGDRLLLRRGA
jgi:hypothetical protein